MSDTQMCTDTQTRSDAHVHADMMQRTKTCDVRALVQFGCRLNLFALRSSFQMEETHSKPPASSGNAAWSAQSKAKNASKKAACTRLRKGKEKARSLAAESAERNTLGLPKRICLEPVHSIVAGGLLVGVVAPELGTLIAAAPEAFGEDCVCVRFNDIVQVVVLADLYRMDAQRKNL
jgi:hypothetical protein